LLPGGGHEGKVYETTPDGRQGWATYFVRKGLSVYNADGVNRGASSYDITGIVLVSQGNAPLTAIPSMNRYTHELAWTQFRIGPSFGVPFPTSQFPVEAFEQYTNQLVPAFRDPVEDDKNVAALVALLDRIGPAIVLTWSQSGRFGIRAAVQRPHRVKAIVALEPAAVSAEGMMTGVSAPS
jgi:pimeloyl-ACP methyl ester carboxylesterase